jgi:hypothetical protein
MRSLSGTGRGFGSPARTQILTLAATRAGQSSRAMNTLDKLLSKYSWPTKNFLDDTDFVDTEQTIGFELPEDYKDFLSKYVGHETQIGQESFKLWNKKDLISLNEGYSILENLSRTVAIGDNGGGEFIGLEKSIDGGLRVILTPFIDLDEQYHIEIGSSFTDFLLRMDMGEKWFKDVKKDS